LFDVNFFADNATLDIEIKGVSSIKGYVNITMRVYAYGYLAYEHIMNPCDTDLTGLCPMNQGNIPLKSTTPLDSSDIAKIPGIAYTVPDLDAKVQVFFNDTTGASVACVEAQLSNGKTVNQIGVAWTLAVISGLALVASAITSGLGHSNTAAHVAANALALFSYFQAQAFIGLCAVPLPPIVSAWTQNFQWSMGIINVGFLQDIATWYQRATGGTASVIINNLGNESVQVQKRSLEVVGNMAKRAAYAVGDRILKRAVLDSTTQTPIIVTGIKRAGFNEGIEPTNIFLTGYIFFLIFVVFTTIGVLLFKLIVEGLVRTGNLSHDKFQDFRNGWTTVLKGILFRIVLIGFPQMVVLCFWEFTVRDSGAEVVLAVFTVFTMLAILIWASSKVIRLARRSIAMHKNPAYILYSDPVSLNKWGFLYVQFKATAYYFIVPVFAYVLIKGMFIALAQSSGTVQALALVVIEAVFLIVVCVLLPYMDKKTNTFNIVICVVNFLNAIFLMVFTHIFSQPGLVTGVMGVVFFIYNAVFSTVLLVIVIVASIMAIVSKNPETRYQPMRDDRGSFIKSQTQLNTELDALGATARGESKMGWTSKTGARIEDEADSDSWSGGSGSHEPKPAFIQSEAPARSYYEPPRSPINPSAQGFPTSNNNSARHLPPNRMDTPSPHMRPGSNHSRDPEQGTRFRAPQQQQSQNFSQPSPAARGSPSPWQRGAGYE